MTQRAVIGITCDFVPTRGETRYATYARYVDGVQRAGALALVLPPSQDDVEHQLDLVDGVLLTGGDDLDPALWGGRRADAFCPSDPRRTEYEMALALAAMEREKPLLGVCLGAQVLNVAAGGSLRADLGDVAAAHRDEARGLGLRHDIDVMKGSLLARSLRRPEGGRLSVNSKHRNAPDGLGEKFRASALSLDGIIEAIEHRDLAFCLGVQWHPEGDAATEPASAALFESFAEACLAGRAVRR